MPCGGLDIELVSKRLQDAVADPARWSAVLHEVSHGLGASGGILFSMDQRFKRNPCSPDLEEMTDIYFREGWFEHDPRYRGLGILEQVGVMREQDFLTEDEASRLPFYNDFLARKGLRWFAGVGFRAGSDLWCLSIQRSAAQGPFQRSDDADLRALLRPFGDAATLARQIGSATLSGMTFGLEAIGHGAVVCDHKGRALDMNDTARRLLDPYVGPDGVFHLPVIAAAQFDALLRTLAVSGRPTDAAPVTCRLRLGPDRYLCRGIRILGDMKLFFSQANLLVLIRREPESLESVLAARYGLTPAEQRVCLALAGGIGVNAMATQFGVRPNTVRAQLKSVFAKTAARGQAQLVSLCAGLRMECGS